MKKLEAIKKIIASKANDNAKDALCQIVGEWETYQQLKRKHPKKGLLNACYRNLGVKFIGLYGLNTLDDAIRKAENNNLLA